MGEAMLLTLSTNPLAAATSAFSPAATPGWVRPSSEARFLSLFLTHETRTCSHRKGDPRADALEAELVSLLLCTGPHPPEVQARKRP